LKSAPARTVRKNYPCCSTITTTTPYCRQPPNTIQITAGQSCTYIKHTPLEKSINNFFNIVKPVFHKIKHLQSVGRRCFTLLLCSVWNNSTALVPMKPNLMNKNIQMTFILYRTYKFLTSFFQHYFWPKF
jgi:hypothetical protein